MGTDNASAEYHASISASVEFVPRPMVAPLNLPPESWLGARLELVRNHFGLSVDALARVTKAWDDHEGKGISATALLRYEAKDEAKRALPGAREIRLLSQALGVSADWLLTGVATPGVEAAQQEVLAALFKLHRLHEERSMFGEANALTPEYAERASRLQRIAEAKSRR
jgi:transcriptional regulator with XRE-family HTH domain